MCAGKTTLLKLLEGELQVDAGAIFTPAHLARRLVTMKENNTVHGTVKDNILFGSPPLHAAQAERTWTVQQLRASAIYHGWIGHSDRGLSHTDDEVESGTSALKGSTRISSLLKSLDESTDARELLATEMKQLATEELGKMAREFGLHRNGKATMAEMLEGDVETLSSTQCMIVAVLRAIVAGTDILLLDGIFDQLHSSTLTSLVQALRRWQENRGAQQTRGGDAYPKTILVAVRNTSTPVAVMDLCPSVTKIESFVSHSRRSAESATGNHAEHRRVVHPQLSVDVPAVPDADADAEGLPDQELPEAAPPPLPPTPDGLGARP